MVKLFFLGTDKRSSYLKELYKEEVEIVEEINNANYVILPIPFTKDKVHITGENDLIEDVIKSCSGKTIFSGGVPKDFERLFEDNNVNVIDLMKLDEVALLNAIPTAEGAIVKAMEETDITLHGANILVLGFGRVGKILADKLKGMNANVFCEARSKKDLAHIKALGYNIVELNSMDDYLKDMDVIFSTIPAVILNEEKLMKINKDAVIIDLASSPGSVDFESAEKFGIKAFLELGIPTKVAPKSAAEYLKESIDNVIKNRGIKK